MTPSLELIKDLAVEVGSRVRYSETDRMGVVYHANYLIWFNVARDELVKKLGVDIGEGEKRGYLMPVVEAYCRYHFPSYYGDEVIIRAVPERTTVARLVVHYEVFHSRNKRLLAEGKTVSVLMTAGGKLLIRVPEEYREVMRRITR